MTLLAGTGDPRADFRGRQGTLIPVADAELQALLDGFHAVTASSERYRILEYAAGHQSFGTGDLARTLNRDWTTARDQIKALIGNGILEIAEPRRYVISELGLEIHLRLARGTGVEAALRDLVGSRVIAVRLGRSSDPRRVTAALKKRALAIAHSDGDIDLIAVLPDNSELVEKLRFQMESFGVAEALRARVAQVSHVSGKSPSPK